MRTELDDIGAGSQKPAIGRFLVPKGMNITWVTWAMTARVVRVFLVGIGIFEVGLGPRQQSAA